MLISPLMNAVEQAVKACGTLQALGDKLGVSRQVVWKWARTGRPPAERVLAIEAATSGAVTRYELRPDIYPKDAA